MRCLCLSRRLLLGGLLFCCLPPRCLYLSRRGLVSSLLLGGISSGCLCLSCRLLSSGLLLGVGVLGGFTTFSAFSLEVGLMLRRQELGSAAIYAAGSAVLSVAALFAGMALARRMFA